MNIISKAFKFIGLVLTTKIDLNPTMALLLVLGVALYFFSFVFNFYKIRVDSGTITGYRVKLSKVLNDMESKYQLQVPVNEQTEYKHGYQSGPVVNLTRTPYFVRGTDRHELCDQIASDARTDSEDRVTLGHINYSMHINSDSILNENGYTIGDFKVITISNIVVPQWESSAGASEDTKSDWRKFKNSVVAHEERHQKILVDYATKLVQLYNSLEYFDSHEEVEAAINRLYSQVFAEMEQAQINFDNNNEDEDFNNFCNNED